MKGTTEELDDAIDEYNAMVEEQDKMRLVNVMHPNDMGKFHDLQRRLDELLEYINKLKEELEKEE